MSGRSDPITRARCQICGRRKGLNKAAGIRSHYVAGVRCLGVDYPPIEHSDRRLEEVARACEAAYRAASTAIDNLVARRANWIDPNLYDQRRDNLTAMLRLKRRLVRHRAWPDRFAKQMEQNGYGDPPPDYLLAGAA